MFAMPRNAGHGNSRGRDFSTGSREPQHRSSMLWRLTASWCRHEGTDDDGGASKLSRPDAAGARLYRPASGRGLEPGDGEPDRRLLQIPFPPPIRGDLRIVRASLCPACPYAACFWAIDREGRSERHRNSDRCRLRLAGRVRSRFSAEVRPIAFVLSQIARLGAVARGLRAPWKPQGASSCRQAILTTT